MFRAILCSSSGGSIVYTQHPVLCMLLFLGDRSVHRQLVGTRNQILLKCRSTTHKNMLIIISEIPSCYFSEISRPAMGHTKSPIQWVTSTLSPERG